MTSLNGQAKNGDAGPLQGILDALRSSYDPYTPNDLRQSALQYLSDVKKHPEAPHHGYTLASDPSQQAFARHFGLSLLESAIRYGWDDHSEEQANTLREWVTALAQNITPDDPTYLRNKIAYLWAEVAKREWAGPWMNMDEQLVELWQSPDNSRVSVYRVLVLGILEGLSEDICNREDPIAGLRQEVLGQSLNEIVIPQKLYKSHLESRGSTHNVRYTTDGWLDRMSTFLVALCQSGALSSDSTKTCVVKTLEAIKPTLVWISLEAIIETNVINCLVRSLASGDEAIQTASIEVLYAILSRQYNPHFHSKWSRIFGVVLDLHTIDLLKRVYISAHTSADVIDDTKYTLQKKISEVLSVVGDAVAQHPELLKGEDQTNALFDVLVTVFSSESLLVSIPVLHSLTKIMESKQQQIRSIMDQAVGVLLDTCSSRLLRYESLPKDSDHAIIAYLHEDFETLPEQHAFLGNYRRYCTTIIEHVGRSRPREALQHVLGQAIEMIRSASPSSSAYQKNAIPVLQLDAQQVVAKSALNGFSQRLASQKHSTNGAQQSPEIEHETNGISSDLEGWCHTVMSTYMEHPDAARIVAQLLVEVINRIPRVQASFVVAIITFLLDLQIRQDSSNAEYTDAVKTFQAARLMEMQRLAISFPNQLFDIYDQLQARIDGIIKSQDLDERSIWGLRALLLITVHRTNALNDEVRMIRLQNILQPISQAWQDQSLSESLSSFSSFCSLVGLQSLPNYLHAAKFSSVRDWPAAKLDADGQSLQSEINSKLSQLPLRLTTSMLGASTEKLMEGSGSHKIARALWAPLLPAILPNVLALMKQATAFACPDNWSSLPDELQIVLRKMLIDRFWQSGISNESRDDFTARITGSGSTYEGFASTVRGTPRQIRDSCYHIIHGMTRFEEEFYSLTELPAPLADALLGDAHCLTTHHLQRLVSLIERLVQRCPPHHRQHFLPPLLTLCFSQLDRKIQQEWEDIERANQESSEEDQLSNEMKAESVVRSTTYSVVMFVSNLLDVRMQNTTEAPGQPTLRTLVLSEPSILEPLILFCTHALRMRDSRCCTIISRVLSSIIPTFRSDTPPSPQVREFICTEVLKAAITSLNEPYFVDVQKDLANLIATIIHLYLPKTSTPRDILLSLPDMNADKVDRAAVKICESQSERNQRALVLQLLEGVRGVSIHEQGRIDVGGKGKAKKSALQQQFMEVESKPAIVRGHTPEGLGDMFGGE